MTSHSSPSSPLQTAWQMACQSSSTSGALHLLFLTCVVSKEERHQFPFMRTQTELVRSFPKNQLPGSLLQHCRMVVNCCKLPEPFHYSEATFLQRTWYDHLDWAVAIFLLVCQKLEAHGPYRHTFLAVPRALETLEHFGRFLSSFFDQDSIRGPSTVLAATNCTPLHCFQPRPEENHQMQFSRGETVTMRTHVRHNDSSHFVDWCDDPPPENAVLHHQISSFSSYRSTSCPTIDANAPSFR